MKRRHIVLAALAMAAGLAVPVFSQQASTTVPEGVLRNPLRQSVPMRPAAGPDVPATVTPTPAELDQLKAAANAVEPKIAPDVDYRVKLLKIDDPDKAARLTALFLKHLTAVYAWHKDHGAKYEELVPPGLNLETGKKLNNYERMYIADSAIPASVHKDLMDGLKKELTQEQIWTVMDDYTEPQRKEGGKVTFTYSGYIPIIGMDKARPNLTQDEKVEILKNLRAAAELSMELPTHGIAKNGLVSEVFDHYKKKNENYFDAHGRDWHALYSANYNRSKNGG